MRRTRNNKRRKVSRKVSYKEEESEEEIEMKGKIDGDIESFRLDCWKLLKFKIKEYLLDDKKSSIVQKEINKIEKDVDKIKYLIERFPLNETPKAGKLLGGVCSDNPIKVALDLTVSIKLNRVFSKHFEKEGLSKRALVKEFLMKIYGEASSLEKRDMEDENVKSIGKYLSDDDFKFFSLCGFTLPNELIERILDYLPRNLDILSGVGGSCQFLYIKLLTTWKDIKVHGTNVFLTSTLALQNVEHLSIQKVTQAEQKYVWEHVNSSKLRRISIFGNLRYFRSVMNGIIKFKKNLKKNEDDPFRSIRELDLQIDERNSSHKKKMKSLNVTFKGLFPNLTTITGIPNLDFPFQFLEGISGITEFGFTEIMEDFYWNYGGRNTKDVFKYINEYEFKKDSVKKMKISISSSSSGIDLKQIELVKCLEKFPNLNELFLGFSKYKPSIYYWNNTEQVKKKFFLSNILCPSQKKSGLGIKTLEISFSSEDKRVNFFDPIWRRNMAYYQSRHKDDSFSLILMNDKKEVNKNLQTLRIFGSEKRNRIDYIPDFNFEDFLTSNFFDEYMKNGNLNEFYGDISLFSRSERNMRLLCPKPKPKGIPHKPEEGKLGRLRKQKNELQKMSNIFLQSCVFFFSTIFNFKKFTVVLRNTDEWFVDERVIIKYDSYTNIRRMRIEYINSKSVGESGCAVPDQCLQNDEISELFQDIKPTSSEKESELILKYKRPSLLLFFGILKSFILDFKVIGKIDILEISVKKEIVRNYNDECDEILRRSVNLGYYELDDYNSLKPILKTEFEEKGEINLMSFLTDLFKNKEGKETLKMYNLDELNKNCFSLARKKLC